MNRNSLSRMFAVMTVLSAPIALPAFAQTASPLKPAKSSTEIAATRNMVQNVDAHIAMLHGKLQITPAEEGQWTIFAQVMRDNAAEMTAAFSKRGAALPSMNAVQDLQSYAQIALVQSDTMQKLSTAFQTLYASFPPAQQKVADAVFRPAKVER